MKRGKRISALYKPKYINSDSANYLRSAILTEQEEINVFDVEHRMIKFGEIVVSTHSIPPVLTISDVCNKDYLKEWNEDTGRFFCTDLKRGNKNLYYEITTSLIRAIVRQITQEEAKDDEFAKFEKVKIGDFEYAIIKAVNIDSDYNVEDINTKEMKDVSDEKIRLFEESVDMSGENIIGDDDSNDEPIYLDESISTDFNFSDDDDE